MPAFGSKLKKILHSITFKTLIGSVLLLIILAVIVAWVGYTGFTRSMMEQYSDSAFRTADAAVTLIDADQIDQYMSMGGSTEDYRRVKRSLDRVCNATSSTFIYVIIPDLADYGHITFVFSTVNADSSFTEFEFGYVRETTNDEYRQKYALLYDGSSQKELVVRDSGYIPSNKHITAMVPLVGSDGLTKGILCVQYQLDVLDAARMDFLHNVLKILIILLIIAIIVQIFYIGRLLLNPIRTITEEASRFAVENVPAKKRLLERIRNKDEIGILAESVDQMEEQIQQYIEHITSVTAEKERMKTELSLAKSIQESMLPDTFPAFAERTEFDLYASMDPAREVGGDFYDFFLIDQDHLGILIADVSGKGIPAALFMMISMNILHSISRMGKSPAQILEESNSAICSNNKNDMFVSVWLGILEISTGKLTAANAGHEYPMIRHGHGSFELIKDKHGLVLGAVDSINFKEYEITMEPGSKIFVYTDGVPEANDAQNNMFGMERLEQALNLEPDASPQQVLNNVRNAVDQFVNEAEQFDDLTMLCLEYKGISDKS